MNKSISKIITQRYTPHNQNSFSRQAKTVHQAKLHEQASANLNIYHTTINLPQTRTTTTFISTIQKPILFMSTEPVSCINHKPRSFSINFPIYQRPQHNEVANRTIILANNTTQAKNLHFNQLNKN